MKNSVEQSLTPFFKITCDKRPFTTRTKFKIREMISQSLKKLVKKEYKIQVKEENLLGCENFILEEIVEFNSCAMMLRAYYTKYFLCIDAFWFDSGKILSKELQNNFINFLRTEIIFKTQTPGVPIIIYREIGWKDVSYSEPSIKLQDYCKEFLKKFNQKNKKPRYTQKPVYLRKN